MASKVTIKREKFCQYMAAGVHPKTGKLLTQSEAYRLAFKPMKMTKKTITEKSSKLMADDNIRARIQQLMQPIVEQVQVTREQWLKKMEAFFHADVRKMFDEFGNPVEIPRLGDHEAAMIEGFEFCEDYTKVKKASGDTDAVATGYTKKVKLTPKLKAMLEFGKVMGWYTEKRELEAGATLEQIILASLESSK